MYDIWQHFCNTGISLIFIVFYGGKGLICKGSLFIKVTVLLQFLFQELVVHINNVYSLSIYFVFCDVQYFFMLQHSHGKTLNAHNTDRNIVCCNLIYS
jgi:hypothetical protein